MPITSEHPLYTKNKCRWKITEDAVNSEYECYVIPPTYTTTRGTAKRRENYIKRAIYYNFVASTLKGWVGLVTQKSHTVKLPAGMEYLKESATSNGLSLEGLEKECLRQVNIAARYILYTDYPAISTELTEEE